MKIFLQALWECIRDGAKSGYAAFSAVLTIIGAAKDLFGFSIPFPSTLIWICAFILIFIAYLKSVWLLHQEQEKRLGPDVVLLPPKHIYSLSWDAPNSLQIITEPKLTDGEHNPLGTRLPVFRIKNVGHAVAKTVRLRWRIVEIFSLEAVTRTSSRMKKYNYRVSANSTRSEQTQGNTTVAILGRYATVGISELPYLVPQMDQDSFTFIEMPASVYEACELYFAAKMPDDKPYQSLELNCIVEVSCQAPAFYIPQRFNVRILARDDGSQMQGEDKIPLEFLQQNGLKPKPALKAYVKFEIGPHER